VGGSHRATQRAHINGWTERQWRHLDTCQLETIIKARVPQLKYSDGRAAEFKELAVKRVSGGEAIAQVARELGLVDQTQRNWVKAAKKGRLNAPGGKAVTPEPLCILLLRYLEHLFPPVASILPAYRWKTKFGGKLTSGLYVKRIASVPDGIC
jgi:hypothetical protein